MQVTVKRKKECGKCRRCFCRSRLQDIETSCTFTYLLHSSHSLVRHLTLLDSIFTSTTVDYCQYRFHHFSWFNRWEENERGDGLVIWVSLSSCSILQTSWRYTNSSSRSSISLHLMEAKQIWKNGVEVSKLIWQLSLCSYVRVKIEYHEHLHASPNLTSRYKSYLIV